VPHELVCSRCRAGTVGSCCEMGRIPCSREAPLVLLIKACAGEHASPPGNGACQSRLSAYSPVSRIAPRIARSKR